MAVTAIRNTYFALCMQHVSTTDVKPTKYDHQFAKPLGYSLHPAQRQCAMRWTWPSSFVWVPPGAWATSCTIADFLEEIHFQFKPQTQYAFGRHG